MDNDNFLKRNAAKIFKKIKFNWDYNDIDVLSEESGNNLIYKMLNSSKPFSVTRSGATEMRCVAEYLRYINQTDFSDKIRREISELSGVFPTEDNFLKRFCEYYIKCVTTSDVLAIWDVGAESQIVHQFCREMHFTKLRALEPYYFSNPWTRGLKGKRVLVLHPFSTSIMQQYQKREQLFLNRDILPQFKDLVCVPTVQSIAGQETSFSNWFEALDHMFSEIEKYNFDIAIIGAGAYGLPLASHIKSLGKQAIQMAGSTQILFGIKGKRWDDHPIISRLYNDAWVRPTEHETPKNKNKVEGGSYW